MREIDVQRYPVKAMTPEGVKEVPYDVQASMVNVLFAQERMKAVEVLKRHAIAEMIRKAEGSVLLEEADYEVLKGAFDAFEGWREQDVELIQRVLEAPKVEIARARE